MHLHERFNVLIWLLALGYLGFYLYAVIVGLLDPAEMAIAGVAAAAVAILFALHTVRVRHAMRDRDDPAHRPMMHALHVQRERRGF